MKKHLYVILILTVVSMFLFEAGNALGWGDEYYFGMTLYDIGDLTPDDGTFIVGDGTTWVAESGNTARTSLGLGTGDSPTFLALNSGVHTITVAGVAADGLIVNNTNNLAHFLMARGDLGDVPAGIGGVTLVIQGSSGYNWMTDTGNDYIWRFNSITEIVDCDFTSNTTAMTLTNNGGVGDLSITGGFIGSVSKTDAVKIEDDGDIRLIKDLSVTDDLFVGNNITIGDDGFIGSDTIDEAIQILADGTVIIGDGTNETVTSGTGILSFGGTAAINGLKTNRTSVTSSPYTILSTDDHISVTTASVAITTNLPAIVDGKIYHIKDQDGNAAGNNITVSPAGGDTVENAASLTISTNYASVTLIGNSTTNNWEIQ
jgi:hypothetical protein